MQTLTDISTVRALCEQFGFSLQKGYGQNFIINPGICPKLCNAAGLLPQSNVLEIGPGFGTLTQQLAQRASKVVALEVDARLLPVLQHTLQGFNNVQVLHQDAMTADLGQIIQQQFGGGPVKVCANLPYNITSPLLMKLLESRLPLESITVMVQKEAAQRIAAQPGTRQAGAISYAVHYYTTPKLVFTVKPGSFYPPPKVTSAVIHLTPVASPQLAGRPQQEKRLFRLIRAAFSQRRKTLNNGVSAGLGLPKSQVAAAQSAAGIAPMARPEELTLQNFIALEAALWA